MQINLKRGLLVVASVLSLYACAVGTVEDIDEEGLLDGAAPPADGSQFDAAATGGGPGATADLDSGPGGTFAAVDGGVRDASSPRDSSVRPVDSSTPGGDADLLASLGGLLGGLGGLFGGGDAGAP